MSEEGVFVGKGCLSGEVCKGAVHCGDGRHWEARDRELLSTYCRSVKFKLIYMADLTDPYSNSFDRGGSEVDT